MVVGSIYLHVDSDSTKVPCLACDMDAIFSVVFSGDRAPYSPAKFLYRWPSWEEGNYMKGHLLQYPVNISSDGKVSALNGFEYFPDVGGKILGSPNSLPDALTT